MSPNVSRGKGRSRVAALAATVVTALAVAVVAGCGDDGESLAVVDQAVAAEHSHAVASPQIHTEAGHAFQDEMRKLWEDHVTWTRLAIVSFVDELSDLEPTVARLLQNQSDIGDAIKPYYGDDAGDQLTTLLEGHINGAVDLLSAAKAGNRHQVKKASCRLVSQRQSGCGLPQRREPGQLAARGDALDDADAPRPDAR